MSFLSAYCLCAKAKAKHTDFFAELNDFAAAELSEFLSSETVLLKQYSALFLSSYLRD